ncbi:unnamed protein product [Trichogramma brassicae]|uniref:Uncharacterized protein n=1 Tax=Trichogramma brassicae TaxID=86971 RepID=A0A6H5HWB4_9HYME|nr:unnamed protein product [Trichogramma brassicae]
MIALTPASTSSSKQHQLARNNLSVSPDVQRHQHVTTRTQAATATSPDSGSVTPPPTPLSSRVTNANVSHSPESPRRTLRPRAAATQQPRLQTTSRAWRATSVPAESQGSQRQQRLPKGLSSRPKSRQKVAGPLPQLRPRERHRRRHRDSNVALLRLRLREEAVAQGAAPTAPRPPPRAANLARHLLPCARLAQSG